MKEIGGYIELDSFTGKMLYEDSIKLNCGRNALAYLIEVNNIKKIVTPKFMCDSCNKVLWDRNVSVRYYSIGLDFKPIDLKKEDDEWIYIVNFYGQLSNDYLAYIYDNYTIIDNAQAYFQPLKNINTLYTCRKFVGVADGAILYCNKRQNIIEQDEFYNRMNFLLGRYERTASEFYDEYSKNNKFFLNEAIKKMSKLTLNILYGLDYKLIEERRTKNFEYLYNFFKNINKCNLLISSGAYMYPLYMENGSKIRKELQEKKIYIPTLWPADFDICKENELEYSMAKDILSLPVDQRYMIDDMKYVVSEVMKCIS